MNRQIEMMKSFEKILSITQPYWAVTPVAKRPQAGASKYPLAKCPVVQRNRMQPVVASEKPRLCLIVC